MEVARRQKVVKVWKLQAKMMERQRRLEDFNGCVLQAESHTQMTQDNLEKIDQILGQCQGGHAQSEATVGKAEDFLVEMIQTPIQKVPKVPESLLEVERLIQEDEEEILALR